jgi:hypothetical protein
MVAVEHDRDAGTLVQQLSPANVTCIPETHGSHLLEEQVPLHVVISARQVREEAPAGVLVLPQPLCKAEVVKDVVRDVAPAYEGRLTRRDEDAERQLQAVGNGLGHDSHIRVEEADGPVTRQLIRWLARLEEELEGCMEDGAESRGGAGVERLLDSRDEEWEDCVAKALVELIGEAVWTGSCSNAALAEHMLQLCQRESSPPLFNVRCKTGCEARGRGC